MQEDFFKIFVEQLRDGQIQAISEQFTSDFLEVCEEDLSFQDDVEVSGKAYLADDDLILQFDIETQAVLPCSICNVPVKVDVRVLHFYHVVPLSEVKSGIYNFKEILREAILLETPRFVECNQGKCPQRPELSVYLKKDSDKGTSEYHPFADLDKDIINKNDQNDQ